MPAKHHQTRNAITLHRQQQALALKKQGLTFREIGLELEITAQSAHALFHKAMAEMRETMLRDATELRDLAHLRHEQLLASIMPMALGDEQCDGDRLRHLEAALKIIQQDAKLMGYAAPEKHQVDVTHMQAQLGVIIDIVAEAIPAEHAQRVVEALDAGLATVSQKEGPE